MVRLVESYFHFLKFAIVVCLALMVVLVFGNVILRYGFNSGITVAEEISRWLFVYLTFLGAIVAMREHGHLGVDSLVSRLPSAGKKLCLLLSHVLMLWGVWLFLSGSWQQTVINIPTAAPSSGLSMSIFYAVGVVFSVSAGGILLYDLYRILAGKLAEGELVMVKESEEHAELEELQKELAMQDQHHHRPGDAPSGRP